MLFLLLKSASICSVLRNGKVYYAIVRAINLGFTVADRPGAFVWNQRSGPIISAVWSSVDGSRMSVGWSPPVDPETRLVTMAEWAVGTDPRAASHRNDVKDWAPLLHLRATTASVSGLDLWHGKSYWISFRWRKGGWPGICLKEKGGLGAAPLQSGAVKALTARLLPVGNAVGADVGAREYLWGGVHGCRVPGADSLGHMH